MRKGLAVGAMLTSLLLAGCGGQAEQAPQEPGDQASGSTAPSTSSTKPQSQRTAPAKSLQLADKCSIVTEQQWSTLGANQPPNPRSSNGRPGCQYQKGKAGTPGWGAFVATDGRSTFSEQVQKRQDPTRTSQVAGYPVASYETSIGCVLFADVSDKGYLVVNVAKTGTTDTGVDLCQKATQFAEAAVQNLPNA